MPDPHGDGIRRLVGPPAPAWNDRGPATKTIRQDIRRWYQPAGGLGIAAFLAQLAAEKNGSKPFDPNAMDEKIPVQMANTDKSTAGWWKPSNNTIVLSDKFLADPAQRQSTLEHERTHGMLKTGSTESIDPVVRYSANSHAPEWVSYVKSPSEIDARLAQIKRRYAFHTGKIVDTPEEAIRALKWYGRNHDNMDPESPDYDRDLKATAGEYLLMPKDKRDKVMKRMTEVVDTGGQGGFNG